jgi:hypothetical protein
MHAAPAVPWANCTTKTPTSIQVQRRQSDFPCAMVLTVYTCSPRRSGLGLSPSLALLSANLTPALRRQDHTILPSASAPFVIGASASIAARPASVTIANRPSEWDGMANHIAQFSLLKNRNIFAEGAGHATIRTRVICPSGSHTAGHTDTALVVPANAGTHTPCRSL